MNNPASLRSEVTSLDWINCPVCRGIADQFAVERLSSLSGIRIVCAYWLYKLIPELQLILYPFASLAISVTADMVETRWKNQASGF